MTSPPPEPLFDRARATRRLDRAWETATAGADFLLARAADDLAERLSLVNRGFAFALDAGTPGPHAAAALAASGKVERVVRLAPSRASLGEGSFLGAVGDVERLPAAFGRFDLAVSLMSMQGVNDLPGALIQLRSALAPDGLAIVAFPGGETLTELRQSLIAAESALLGGAAARVAPFVDLRALGGLAQRAGFALPVVDRDRVVARYRDLTALARDLSAFGGRNPLGARAPLRREALARAAAIYAERFADPDGRIRATFDIVWLSAWSPHPDQPRPLRPGSAARRLADALKRPADDAG